MRTAIEIWWEEEGKAYHQQRVGYWIIEGDPPKVAFENAIKETAEKYHEYREAWEQI